MRWITGVLLILLSTASLTEAATTDALGQIRVDIYYATSTPPTS